MGNTFNDSVDYSYYFNNYSAGQRGSILTAEEFEICELRAREFLKGICTEPIPDENADSYYSCVCALAEKIHAQKRNNIKSENIDGYSVTYNNENCQKELYKIAILYIGNLGVLYAGVR